MGPHAGPAPWPLFPFINKETAPLGKNKEEWKNKNEKVEVQRSGNIFLSSKKNCEPEEKAAEAGPPDTVYAGKQTN